MILLPLLAAAATTAPTPASPEQAKFDACAALAEANPTAALAEAGSWRINGGGVPARQCEGLAYVAQKRWAAAAAAFEAAARDAETKADGRASNLWIQTANAALAGKDPATARRALDAALVLGQTTGVDLGELYVDRARARFALDDKKGARDDLDAALKLVPGDPLAWLLSATLARQMGDLERARTDIGGAMQRSPDDSSVALEAGNIALLSGNATAARTAWEAAVRNQPGSPAALSAAEALKQLPPS